MVDMRMTRKHWLVGSFIMACRPKADSDPGTLASAAITPRPSQTRPDMIEIAITSKLEPPVKQGQDLPSPLPPSRPHKQDTILYTIFPPKTNTSGQIKTQAYPESPKKGHPWKKGQIAIVTVLQCLPFSEEMISTYWSMQAICYAHTFCLFP